MVASAEGEGFYPRRPVAHRMVGTAGVAPRDAVRDLDAIERRLAQLDRRIGLAEWALYTGRGNEGASVRWQTGRARFLRARGPARVVARLSGGLGAPLLERRVELLRRAILDAHVEQAPEIVRTRLRLQARIVRFRPLWHGRRVGRAEVYEALRSSPDRGERERAYYSEESLLHSLEAPLRHLLGVRNDLARSAGFSNFAAVRLSFEGVPAGRLRAIVREVVRGVSRAAHALREEETERTGDPAWAPWDLRYALEQRAPLPPGPFPGRRMVATVRRALAAWGVPPRRRAFRIVQRDLPFGGLTFAVEVPRDVRILVHPKGGWEYYMVLFHEYGHAVHFASVDQPTHLLRTTDAGYSGFAEGIAGVFERIAEDPNWLGTVKGLDAGVVGPFSRARAHAAWLEAAGTALGIETELRLYERPDSDPTPHVRALARRWFGYDAYRPRSWANPFFVTHPVYVQSYLLSQLFRSQVAEAMERATAGPFWPNPRAGPWLTEAFLRPGARHDWTDRLRDVTGAPLSGAAFARAAAAAP
jgi:hypothetical protein